MQAKTRDGFVSKTRGIHDKGVFAFMDILKCIRIIRVDWQEDKEKGCGAKCMSMMT